MGWLLVACASVFEILGVLGLRLYSQNKTVANGLLYLGGLGASFAFLYASFSPSLAQASYMVACPSAVIVATLELAFPVAVQYFIDDLLPGNDWDLIVLVSVLLLLVYILSTVFPYGGSKDIW